MRAYVEEHWQTRLQAINSAYVTFADLGKSLWKARYKEHYKEQTLRIDVTVVAETAETALALLLASAIEQRIGTPS